MADPAPLPPQHGVEPEGRWPFIRDVLVLQVKLLIGNLHNLILVPATTVAALLDLFVKSDRHGSRFYRVLEWGRQADEAIGLYDALDRHEEHPKRPVSVDGLVYRIEQAILREYEKGGTTASAKAAVDRVLDTLQTRGDRKSEPADASLRKGPGENQREGEGEDGRCERQ